MKQSFLKGIKRNAVLVIALMAFVIFTGNKNPGNQNDLAAGRCCSGYNIAMTKLKQFMLDSLHGIQFEGGVYSKQSLLTAINQIQGDSVYLMNVLKNCSLSQGTDLALTSPQSTGVVFVRKPNCRPCPGKPCCPSKVCATSIDRGCVNFQSYNGLTTASVSGIPNAEE